MNLAAPLSACLAACALLMTSCATAPTIAVRHDPPYRAEAHTATILVTATSDRGIDHIAVELLTGELVACTQSNLPSIFPCRQNGYWLTFTCDFTNDVTAPSSGTTSTALRRGALGSPRTATCPVSRDLAALSLLTYRATAVDAAGRTASTNFITFSGGAAPPATDVAFAIGPDGPVGPGGSTGDVADLDAINENELPPPPRPTAGDVLRPVWLESSTPPNASLEPREISWDMAQRIDVAFLPHTDWGADYRGFSDATGSIAGDVLFLPADNSPVPPFAADYQFWRQQFSYWVGPAGATGRLNDCRLSFSGWTVAARAVTDGQAVVHTTSFIDCSDFGPGGAGTVWGGDDDSGYLFVHESGHFLHCMGDEYGQEGYPIHGSCSDPPNTFQSKAACEQTAGEYGYPTSWCVQIEHSSSWRITNGELDIMDGDALNRDDSDWLDTANDVILKRMAACLLGSCW